MAKLTDKQKKEIIASYVECQNYSEVGRRFNIGESTVRNIVKDSKNKDIAKKCEQKSKENTEEVLEAMKKRSKTKIHLLDKLFEAMDGKLDNIDMFTNIKDLATAYGIIMDKELKIKELEIKEKENNRDNTQEIKEAKEIIVSIRKAVDENGS